MNRRIVALLGASLVGAAAFAGPTLAGSEYKNQYPNKTIELASCDDEDSTDDIVTWGGPLQMWPPNHKLQPTSITAAGDSDDTVTLRVTGAVDDVAGGDGGPQHDPDIFFNPVVVEEDGPVGYDAESEEGVAAVITSLRAERSGKSGADGVRTYNLSWTADFSDGTEDCTGTFKVTVPHDMSEASDRDGRTEIGNKQ